MLGAQGPKGCLRFLWFWVGGAPGAEIVNAAIFPSSYRETRAGFGLQGVVYKVWFIGVKMS